MKTNERRRRKLNAFAKEKVRQNRYLLQAVYAELSDDLVKKAEAGKPRLYREANRKIAEIVLRYEEIKPW